MLFKVRNCIGKEVSLNSYKTCLKYRKRSQNGFISLFKEPFTYSLIFFCKTVCQLVNAQSNV